MLPSVFAQNRRGLGDDILLATVLTLRIRLITFALMLAVSWTPPKPGSDSVVKPTAMLCDQRVFVVLLLWG